MGKVTLTVAGRDYDLACRDGEEARFQSLGRIVDAKAVAAARATGGLTETRQLLFAALLLADEVENAAAAPPPQPPPPPAPPPPFDPAIASAMERLAARAEALADRLEPRAATS